MRRNFCMQSTLSSFILLCCLFVSFTAGVPILSVFAYASGPDATHQFIFEQARTILRNDGYTSYADFLDSVEPASGLTYLQIMIRGNDENDDELWEATEHYMDPMDHRGWGGFRSAGTLCQERFDEAVSCWKGGDLYNAMWNLGWAAHLLQDVCVPHHAWPTTIHRHVEYEDWVEQNKDNYAVNSGGVYSFPSFPDSDYYTPRHYSWEDVSAYDWVDYNAHESIKHILSAGAAFLGLSDPADPYVETIHPLLNDLETTWVIITYHTSGMQLYFEKIDLQNGLDYVYIYDKYDDLLDSYTGLHTNFWTDWYPVGDTLKIKVTTDSSVQSWGYKLREVKYDDTGQDEHGATSVLLSQAQRTTAGFIKFFFDPLWGMFHSFTTSLGYNVDVFSNSTIEYFEYFEPNNTIKIRVSEMTTDQTYGFCRLTIPHGLLSPPYDVRINDNPVPYTGMFENETLSIIRFSYEHSTLEITIVPEFPLFLIMPLFMMVTLLAVVVHGRKQSILH